MIILDAHCDTLTKLTDIVSDLYVNDFHFDIKRVKNIYDGYIQTFAVFIEPKYMGEEAYTRADKMIDIFHREIQKNSEHIKHCLTFQDLLSVDVNGTLGALLSIEGGVCLNGDIDNLDYFYDRGVRILSLTWNNLNNLACGIVDSFDNSVPNNKRGLSNLGAQVIRKMNRLGMVLDVSHLSEKGFYDVCSITNKPFIASHSNCRSICSHKRNLTDEQLDMIKKVNGVVGINFYPYFINNTHDANSEDIIKHIEYIAALIGEDYIGLGTDFDGIEITPTDITNIADIHIIFNRLLQLNYSEVFLNKFAYQNYFRLFKSILIK